ncbi:MAG: lipid-binding SYLF domain-containing protein, partial [Kiloniellaceae bacterium]
MRAMVTTLMVAVAFVGLLGHGVRAATSGEELVEESRFTLERLRAEKNMVEFQNFLERAKGVLIIPELVKGGLIFGAEGGSGVLLVRGADGSWSSPAFYTLAAGSFGLQIGAQVSEVVFTLMSEGAISAFMNDEFKLGADA